MADFDKDAIRSSPQEPHSASYLLIAWFPALVVFILIPFTVYFPNRNEFGGNLILPSLSALAGVGCFAAVLPILLFRPSIRGRMATMLFFLGVYLALADLLAPVQIGDLTSGPHHVHPVEPVFLTIVEVVLFAASVWAAVRLPAEWVARIGAPFVIALVAIQAWYFYAGIPPDVVLKWKGHTIYQRSSRSPVPGTLAKSGNVYQICFDAYSGPVFRDTLKEAGNADAFHGFTFFENARSNYVFTRASLPSYFTGTFFKGGSAVAWDAARTSGGMPEALHGQGYAVSMYTPDVGYFHKRASHARQLLDVIKDREKSELMFDFYDFADLCLLRIVPNWMQQELYEDGRGLIGRMFSPEHQESRGRGNLNRKCRKDIVQCLPLVRALMEEERDRPAHGQYVYAHFWFTHNPIGNRNSDCTLNEAGDSTYFDHAVCATRIMERFIEELKRLGRFENSTIIFQSDHGHTDAGPKDPNEDALPEDVASRIREVTGMNPRLLVNKTHALLLVKRGGDYGTQLRVSKSPAALVDIPATVYRQLGIDLRTEEGRPIFEIEESEKREIHMFAGFSRRGEAPIAQLSRMVLTKGELVHFSFTKGVGWKLYPDIPFTKD
ncbi:MAG: sulfatase-like hydrolase/transferase [Pseudomonadota bacterium]